MAGKGRKCLWCGKGKYVKKVNAAVRHHYKHENIGFGFRFGEGVVWDVWVAECCGNVQYMKLDMVER